MSHIGNMAKYRAGTLEVSNKICGKAWDTQGAGFP